MFSKFLYSTVDSVRFVEKTMPVQPNQCHKTTPSRFSTNHSLAQLRHDGPEDNLQELTPEYAKLDAEYTAIYSRQRSRQAGEKTKMRERYEFAEVVVGNVTETADYEVPVKTWRNTAGKDYSHLQH